MHLFIPEIFCSGEQAWNAIGPCHVEITGIERDGAELKYIHMYREFGYSRGICKKKAKIKWLSRIKIKKSGLWLSTIENRWKYPWKGGNISGNFF